MSKSVAITGASGFVGSALASRFVKTGWKVFALQRKPAASSGNVETVQFELNQPFDENTLKGLDLFIHGAWQPYSPKLPQADEINIQGARKLQEFTRRNGTKFIFISTTSAHDEATSHYGISKLSAETQMDLQKNLILKPGLVIGNEGGLFQKIAGIIGKSKFIPMVDGGRQPMQTIWIEDLFKVIVRSYENQLCGNYAVAESNAITMKRLYEMIAGKKNARPVFINVPYPLIYSLLRIPEILHLPLPLTTENLKGLKHLRAFDTNAIQQKLGIQLLTAKETIDRI